MVGQEQSQLLRQHKLRPQEEGGRPRWLGKAEEPALTGGLADSRAGPSLHGSLLSRT